MSEHPVSTRDDGIDGLRALAILLVVAYHYTLRFPIEEMKFDHAIDGFRYGKVGVYLFFIISGYCIAMTAGRAQNAGTFLIRRVSRLVPAFTVCVVITALAMTFLDSHRELRSAWQILQNIAWAPLYSDTRMVDGAYWSLFVEVVFYGVIALIMLLFRDLKKSAVAFAALTVVGGILYHAGFLIDAETPFYPMHGVPQTFFLYPNSLFFTLGLLLYSFSDRAIHWIAGGAAVAAFYGFTGDIAYTAWTASAIALSTVILPYRGIQLPKPIVYLGFISFPLYLVHQNAGIAIIRELSAFDLHPYARIIIAFGICVLIAALVSLTVEHRFRKHIEAAFGFLAKTATNSSRHLVTYFSKLRAFVSRE